MTTRKTYADGLIEGRLDAHTNRLDSHEDRMDGQDKRMDVHSQRLRLMERLMWIGIGGVTIIQALPLMRDVLELLSKN